MNFLANPNIVSPFFFKPGTIQLLSEYFFQNLALMTLHKHASYLASPIYVESTLCHQTKQASKQKYPKNPMAVVWMTILVLLLAIKALHW